MDQYIDIVSAVRGLIIGLFRRLKYEVEVFQLDYTPDINPWNDEKIIRACKELVSTIIYKRAVIGMGTSRGSIALEILSISNKIRADVDRIKRSKEKFFDKDSTSI